MKRIPKRRSDLVQQEIDGELVVYDPIDGKAHFLNEVTAFVYRRCDGLRGIRTVARELAPDAPAEAAEDAVRMAVDRLAKSSLITDRPGRQRGPTRREFISRYGRAAVALPAIASVLATVPLSAASACVINGNANCNLGNLCQACTSAGAPDGECATNFCGLQLTADGTSCLDDSQAGAGCAPFNGGTVQQSCVAARAAAGPGGVYGCCICP